MPNGVPLELTPEQAGLYQTIGSMISAGIGADRAYGILKDTGNYIPRATVRAISSEVRTTLEASSALSRVALDNIIPDRLISQDSSLRSNNYVTRVSMLLYDPITLTPFQQFRSYVSPDIPTLADVYAALAPDDGGGDWYAEFGILAMSPVSVSHR